MCDIEVPQEAETLHVITEKRLLSSSLLPPADPKANYLAHKKMKSTRPSVMSWTVDRTSWDQK